MLNRNFIAKIFLLMLITPLFAGAQQLDNNLQISANQQEYLSQAISDSYLLEMPLTQTNCDTIVGQRCDFKDGISGDVYFHPVTLIVFQGKAMAIINNKNGKKTLLKVMTAKNYALKTKNDNIVTFDVKDGEVLNLTLTSGLISKEVKADDLKCNKAKFLYDFYSLYQKSSQIVKKTGSYIDQYDFKGIKEYVIFAPKDNISDTMAIISTQTGINTIENLSLCKLANFQELRVRHISKEECAQNPTSEECSRYQNCEDKIKIKDCKVEFLAEGY